MARGWESKDVEAQLEERESARAEAAAPKLTAEQQEAARRRAALGLDRIRIERELALATHPRRRAQLEAALAHLDAELAKIPH